MKRAADKRWTYLFAIAAAIVFFVAVAALVFYSGTPGKGNALTSNGTNRITVVVSFNPIYYLVKPVVGNSVNIQEIIAPGVEPHDYEPTPEDVVNLSKGSIFFYDGPALENWAVQLAQAANRSIELVPLIDSINQSQINNETNITVEDPHFWLDPALMPSVVKYIESRMVVLDPANAAEYTANANAFIMQLNQLNSAYRTGLARCQSRTVIDSHAFLGYMAISYNLTELAVGSESPDAEVSPQHVIAVIQNAEADHAHAIFQESADPTVAINQNVAQAINGTIYKIYTMEILTPQQLKSGSNYISLMYQDLHILEQGLNCTPAS